MSALNSNLYDIRRLGDRCAATDQPFEPGQSFIAALAERDDGTLERTDYSAEAWSQGARPERLFAHWRGVVPPPGESPRPTLDHDSLLGIFEQLGETEDPRRIAFRYVLCLILVRKRILTIVESSRPTDDGQTRLLVRMKGMTEEDPLLEAIDPHLDEASAAEVIEQLEPLLSSDAS